MIADTFHLEDKKDENRVTLHKGGQDWFYDIPFRSADEFNVSFRILSFYHPATDSVASRLDILVNEKEDEKGAHQYAVAGDQYFVPIMTGASLLTKPKDGLVDGVAFRANSDDLVGALRALADEIEKNAKK